MSSVPRDLGVTSVSAGFVRADARFASALQRSDRPAPGRSAGRSPWPSPGTATRAARPGSAQAFGDGAPTAVHRMRRARTTVADAFGAARPDLARAA